METITYRTHRLGEWISIDDFRAMSGASDVLMVDGMIVLSMNTQISSGKIGLTCRKIQSGTIAGDNLVFDPKKTEIYKDGSEMGVTYIRRTA